MASTAEGATPSRSRMARDADDRIQAKIDAARNAEEIRVPRMEGQPANIRSRLRALKPSNM